MNLNLDYTFSKEQIRGLDGLLNGFLEVFKVDLNFMEESLQIMIVLEWYKANLGLFKFPDEENKLSLKASESIAFYIAFKDSELAGIEGFIAQKICYDIATIITGGAVPTESKLYPTLDE